jgi:signal transduction histidine kinase
MPDFVDLSRWNRTPATLAGIFCSALGVTVLAGWLTGTAVLVEVRPGMSPIQPNGAACFLLWGAAFLLASRRPRASRICIAITVAVTTLTGLEYLLHVDLGIDRVLMFPAMHSYAPGRMLPNPVVLFLLAGATLGFGALRPRDPMWVGIIGSVVLANGVVSLAAYAVGVPMYGWWELTRMPLIGAVGFTVLGAGLAGTAWQSEECDESGAPRWLPVITGVGCVTVSLYLWQGLQSLQRLHVDRILRMTTEPGAAVKPGLAASLAAETDTVLPELALGVGLVLSTLLVFAILFAQVARRRERAAEAARRDLELAIAGRRKAEEQLGVSEEQRLLAMDAAGIGTCSWDAKTGELLWGPRGKELLGLAEDAPVTYDAFLNVVHPNDRETVRMAFETESAEAGAVALEFRVVRPDQSVRWIAFRGRARAHGVAVDATERKLTEQALRRSHDELESLVEDRTRQVHSLNRELQQQNWELTALNRELEAFTYSVSHDLRAPLRHIDGFSKMLVDQSADRLDAAGKRAVDRIRHGAQQMGRMIEDLLEFSRMGRKDLVKRPTHLRPLIVQALELLESTMEGREIDLRIGELPCLECDPSLMKHVLLNLLSNAVKFTRESKPAVIEVGEFVENGMPVVYVRDNGVGFDMRYVDKLFGVFQRLHRREEYEGTGLGLATVQRIIHKHGGRVWAQSEMGKGTTFCFTLTEAAAIARPEERS